ncbi:hypothetical protein [Citromicrobium bathyomarinum]|mgnify:CR=1 FL=1|nr:hypothetical protein [Citromicrobium bathyomarinum]MCD1622431.1 hypothetical protein [Citromicrobium bathyomarinum]
MPKLAQNLLALAVAVLVAGTSVTAITTVPPAQDGTTTYASLTHGPRELA